MPVCIAIEPARESDAGRISEMSRVSVEYGLDRVYTSIRVRAAIRDRSSNVVVARHAGGLAGFGIMRYDQQVSNLDLLAVADEVRRQGIGRQILDWLEAVARTGGTRLVFVQVRRRNTRAIRFYEALDYQVVDQVAGYYRRREAAVILSKSLSSMSAWL